MIPCAYGRCWGSLTGKPLPMELRQRVVDFFDDGHTHRAAAAQVRVSVKFVNDMVLLKQATGALEAKAQGNGGGHGKLAGVTGWTLRRIQEKRDLTLDELVAMNLWPTCATGLGSRPIAPRSGAACAALI